MSYNEAVSGDFWMLDKNGNEIKFNKHGRKLCPIRHVRCRVKSGGGSYLTFGTSLAIKEQVYVSKKKAINLVDRSYKKNFYVQNDDNYLLLLYGKKKNGKVLYKSRIVNYLEVAKLRQEKNADGTYRIKNIKDLVNEPYYNILEYKSDIYDLMAVIQKGTRLLKWEKSPKELYEKTMQELSMCLYVVQRFNDRLHYKLHLTGGGDDMKLETCGFASMKFLIEGRDFEIDELGKIHFYD